MRVKNLGLTTKSIWVILGSMVCLSCSFVLVSFAATTRHYEIGFLYTYDYTLKLELNEPKSLEDPNAETGSTVGYKYISQVQIKPIWQSQDEPGRSILEVNLVRPKLQIKSRKPSEDEGFRDHSSNLETSKQYPLFIHWKDGLVQNVYRAGGDDNSLVNIKKGIANLLQINNGKTEENTPIGRCPVVYKNKDGKTVEKTIDDSSKCVLEGQGSENFLQSEYNGKVLGSKVESHINAKFTLTREASLLEEAVVEESHVVRVNIKKEAGASIRSSQHMVLSDTSSSYDTIVQANSPSAAIKEIEKLKGLELTTETLIPTPEKNPPCQNCKTMEQLLKSMTPQNIATVNMSSAFLQLVARFREAKLREIENILRSDDYILPNLLDVCAASGNLNAHKAAMNLLNFKAADENIANAERYLLGVSLAPITSEEILQDFSKLLKENFESKKLKQSLILTTASMANNFRKQKGDVQIIKNVEDYLLNSLKSCSENECIQLYLRSLKNFKSKSTVPVLFNAIEKYDPKTSVVAMKTLHSFPDLFFNSTHRQTFIKIVKQLGKNYDSSARTLAIDILLRNKPTKDEIKDMLQLLRRHDSTHAEVSTFLWHRLHEFSEMNPQIQKFVWDIVKEDGLNTYHHLSPKGLSTAFTRFMAKTLSSNSSFSNGIEMTGKILKRSSFDVFVDTKEDNLQLLSLGIFAGGLGSFTKSDNENEEEGSDDSENEDDPATAGMDLTLMGIQMRPIIFFVGKGELLGLVWSGAGSERTSALQGNLLMQDNRRFIPLYNGLSAEINIQGGLSFDLAGQIQISLWYRTANSLVENKAGFVLKSIISTDTSFVSSKIDYTIGAEASLHFTSDINFSDGVLMCLKLTQPDFIIKQHIHKTERIKGSRHRLRKAKYNKITIPGISYALNRKNSELCNVMFKDEL